MAVRSRDWERVAALSYGQEPYWAAIVDRARMIDTPSSAWGAVEKVVVRGDQATVDYAHASLALSRMSRRWRVVSITVRSQASVRQSALTQHPAIQSASLLARFRAPRAVSSSGDYMLRERLADVSRPQLFLGIGSGMMMV